MAITSIWSIKNNLKQSINYIINPEKTVNKDYGKNSYSYLEIENAESNYKNEKVCYVSSINCSERNPYKDNEDIVRIKKHLAKDILKIVLTKDYINQDKLYLSLYLKNLILKNT